MNLRSAGCPPGQGEKVEVLKDHTHPSGHWPGFGPRPQYQRPPPRSPGQGKRAAPMRGSKWHPCGGGLKERKRRKKKKFDERERKVKKNENRTALLRVGRRAVPFPFPRREGEPGDQKVHRNPPPPPPPPHPPVSRSHFSVVGREPLTRPSFGRMREVIIAIFLSESARFHRKVWAVIPISFFFSLSSPSSFGPSCNVEMNKKKKTCPTRQELPAVQCKRRANHRQDSEIGVSSKR